jgi:phosphatidylglycerol phospholipase C
LNFLPLCEKYLPGYPITHIGFSISYARRFLEVPNVAFNMLQQIMVGPFGEAFLKDVKAAERPIFLWTVNDETAMKWSIYKGVDGVITDDPKKYLGVCNSYKGEKIRLTVSSLMFIIFLNMMTRVFGVLFRYRIARIAAARKSRRVVAG